MDEKEMTEMAMKMDKLFKLLETHGVVEKVDADGNVLFVPVEEKKSEFYGVMDYFFKGMTR